MKKIKLKQSILLLFTVFTFSMCEENGPIQFIIVDEFPTSVSVLGLEGQSSISINSSSDISDLLDNASSFVEADVESVTLALENYSGTSINGTIQVLASSMSLLNESLTLSTTPTTVAIPANASNILTLITSGSFPITLKGNLTSPLADNDFSIKLTFKVKAKVE